MFNYRVVKTGDCEIELQSFTENAPSIKPVWECEKYLVCQIYCVFAPSIKPVWECEKYLVCQIYCVFQLRDGKCIVSLDQWRDDAIFFVGFFTTDAHGYIHEMKMYKYGWIKFDPPITVAEGIKKEKSNRSSGPHPRHRRK